MTSTTNEREAMIALLRARCEAQAADIGALSKLIAADLSISDARRGTGPIAAPTNISTETGADVQSAPPLPSKRRMWLTGAERTRLERVSHEKNASSKPHSGPEGLRVLPDSSTSSAGSVSTSRSPLAPANQTRAPIVQSDPPKAAHNAVRFPPAAQSQHVASFERPHNWTVADGSEKVSDAASSRPKLTTVGNDPTTANEPLAATRGSSATLEKSSSLRTKGDAAAVTAANQQLVTAASSAFLQLDSIQSDAVRRSLRMRSERKAIEIAERADIEAEEERERRRVALHQRRRQSLGDMTTTFGPAPPVKPDPLLVAVEGRHVVGFGAYRGNDVASGHDEAYAARAARVGGDGAVKDARMLPAVRRDISRAIGVAFDFVGDVASVDVYVRRLREAVRLFDEARATLQSIAGDALYHVADDLAALAVLAVQDPSRVAAPSGGAGDRPSPQAFYQGLFGGMVHSLQRAVLGPAGDAVRLLLRVRAFLAQLQALLEQVDYSLPGALGAATIITTGTDDDRGNPAAWGSSASSVVSADVGDAVDATGRARAAARPFAARPEDKPAATRLHSLALSDARFVSGEVVRCWESRRITLGANNALEEGRVLAEANAAGPPVVEVYSPFSPGSPASRPLQTPSSGFGSPAAARARNKVRAAASAVSTVRALSRRPATEDRREPLYDALHLDPQPGVGLYDDALDFLRFPRAYCCTIAAEIISVDAIAAEDSAALTNASNSGCAAKSGSVAPSSLESTDEGPTDMLAAVMVRTNVGAKEASRVCSHLLWLLWRDVLLLYNAMAKGNAYGGRPAGTGLAGRRMSPERSARNPGAASDAMSPVGGSFRAKTVGAPLASPPPGVPTSQTFPSTVAASASGSARFNEKADLFRSGHDRRTLDVHASMIAFRILEATASVHVFPLG